MPLLKEVQGACSLLGAVGATPPQNPYFRGIEIRPLYRYIRASLGNRINTGFFYLTIYLMRYRLYLMRYIPHKVYIFVSDICLYGRDNLAIQR